MTPEKKKIYIYKHILSKIYLLLFYMCIVPFNTVISQYIKIFYQINSYSVFNRF